MDDEKRESLYLIIELAVQLPVEDCGLQLIHVVREFVDDDDVMEARRVMRLIPSEYFSDYMHTQALQDSIVRDDVARLIETLGYGFWLLAREPAGTT